jgi:hypothetical protein
MESLRQYTADARPVRAEAETAFAARSAQRVKK